MKQALLYDTTLRDGMQGENICFSPEEKVKIAQKLDDLGIHYIEGGWPGSNPSALRFFNLIKDVELKSAKIAAFGSTRRANTRPEEDPNLKALLDSGTPVVTIFGKSWDLHVETVMENTLQENLAMILDSIAYLLAQGREVFYDAEHFYDAYQENQAYAMETLKAAVDGGCRTLVLCDTNGGTLPHDIEAITQTVMQTLGDLYDFTIDIGIHAHNDCSMAVANTIAAVRSGAVMVQGTINGYGERCGNADLTSVIPVLALKLKIPCMTGDNLKKLRSLSRFVSETANMIPLNSRPFVGKSAFTHKGGIHVSAVMKESRAYEHMDPLLVGNKRRVLVSEQSGKSNIVYKAREMGMNLSGKDWYERNIVSNIKELEEEGFQYDVAEASLKILMERLSEQYQPHFELESFRVTIEKNKEHPCYAHATIKIKVGDAYEITAAEGDGPVSALDNALRKALSKVYPTINDMHLVDFKVRVIEGTDGTDAKVRVIIESRDEDNIFSTIGVSEDIIEASWHALADSFQYKLSLDMEKND
ncbi:MAG: citramalate synthase [Desulfobacterium sp.]|nr:citramalate synthase [Desulfobacterium sp.]